MVVRNISTRKIYDTLKSWWEQHDFPILDLRFLPDETFVCYNNDTPIYAMGFYHTNSDLCWLAFPVSNPNVDKSIKANGLSKLIEGMTEYAKQTNYKYIFTTSPIKTVQESLIETGFNLGDEQVNHYIKVLS